MKKQGLKTKNIGDIKFKSSGITLIALVVTIIVLMILAGIAVAALMGDNGLIKRAGEAKEAQRGATVQDEVTLAIAENEMIDQLNSVNGGHENKKTKTDIVNELVTKGYLTSDDATTLETEDAITIGSVRIDFSGLEKEMPKGPNGKLLVNQTTIAELTEDKIVGEDKYGNQVVIPEGFKLAQGENGSGDCVKDGIVIEDGVGNQYVWIPVTNIDGTTDTDKPIVIDDDGAGNKTTVVITLGRYTFNESTGTVSTTEGKFQYASNYATPVALSNGPNTSGNYYQELTTFIESNGLGNATGTNTTARGVLEGNTYNGIKGFIESVRDNKGYYIARYEASYRSNGKVGSIPSTSSSDTLALTNAPSTRTPGDLWNFVTQGEAAEACYDLYTTVNSDLMNSYAWDTAIVYIQEMENSNYAYEGRGSNTTILNTGATLDQKCKIFDMAGNEGELTTEYCSEIYSSGAYPVIRRGGYYYSNYGFVCNRGGIQATNASKQYSFRSVLFL